MSSEKVHANGVTPRGEGLVCTLPPRRLNRRNLSRPSWTTKPTTKRRTRESPGIRVPPTTLLATKEKDTTTTGTETRRSSLKRRTASSRRLLNKVLKDPANIGVFGALVVTTTVDAFLNFFDQSRVERFDQGLDPDPLLEGEEEEDYAPMETNNETQEVIINSEFQQEAEIEDYSLTEVKTEVQNFNRNSEIQQEAKDEVVEIKDPDVQVTQKDPKSSIFSSEKDSTLEISEVGLESLKSENDSKEEYKNPVNIDSSVVPTSGYSTLFTTEKQPLQERATIKQKERVPVRKEASLLSPSILRRSPTDSTGPGSRGNDSGKRKNFSTVVKKEEGDRIGNFRNDMIPVIAGVLFGIVALKWITGAVFTRRTQIDPTTSTSVVQVEPPPPKKSIYDEYEACDESDLEMDDYGKDEGDENEF